MFDVNAKQAVSAKYTDIWFEIKKIIFGHAYTFDTYQYIA